MPMAKAIGYYIGRADGTLTCVVKVMDYGLIYWLVE
jgi:hypothetical protein